ncbi:MAG: Maf family nucleotide pyrophosphatase [Odoribacteraceae bacterium]|jgi:septum formation protein|nr:Maf family nucleotide pyrophosphatase [Odoribacteraceae bacterium]
MGEEHVPIPFAWPRETYRLVLASASPRRQQLMREAGFEFEVRTRPVPEIYPPGLAVGKVPEYLARLKASAFAGELAGDEMLVTADTVVCLRGKIIGKPSGRQEAIDMLTALSGERHAVVTGVCLATATRQHSFSARTNVYFRQLREEEITRYVDTCRPFDKAGAYGIQEWIGYTGITRIEGSFYNVMGLPVQKLYRALEQWPGKTKNH